MATVFMSFLRLTMGTNHGFIFYYTIPNLSNALHSYGTEQVALVKWAPSTTFQRHKHWGGEEILVLDGVFEDEQGVYPKGTWLRNPLSSVHTPFSREGCLIYVKTGHLNRQF